MPAYLRAILYMKLDAVQQQELILCEAREQLLHLRHGSLPAFGGRSHLDKRFEIVLHIADHFPVAFGAMTAVETSTSLPFPARSDRDLNPLRIPLFIDSRSAQA